MDLRPFRSERITHADSRHAGRAYLPHRGGPERRVRDDARVAIQDRRSRAFRPEFVPRPALLTALDAGRGQRTHAGLRAARLRQDPPAGRLGPPARRCVRLGVASTRRTTTRDGCGAPSSPPSWPARRCRRRARCTHLAVPRTTVGIDFLTDLLDALEALPTRVRLVLDDAHHLRSPETLHGLRLLLRNRRSTDPAHPGEPVRPGAAGGPAAAGGAAVRAADGAAELLGRRDGGPRGRCAASASPADQTALLHARTDGWVAGIRLAALPLRDTPTPTSFLAAFSGDERPVADYLAGEVLSRISDAEGELLRRTSICDPLPTALAAELSGRSDAADVLSALERSTGLVVASGPHRTEFRIQELMRSYLTADLYRHGPALAAQLHERAATWWAAQDRPVEALRHAAQAPDGSAAHRVPPPLGAGPGGAGGTRRVAPRPRRGGAGARRDGRRGCRWSRPRSTSGAATGSRRGPTSGGRGQSAPGPTSATSRTSGPPPSGWPAWAVRPPHDGPDARESGAGRARARRPGRRPALRRGRRGPARTSAAVLGDLEAALAVARDQHFDLLEVQCLCLIGTAALTAGDHRRAAAAADGGDHGRGRARVARLARGRPAPMPCWRTPA